MIPDEITLSWPTLAAPIESLDSFDVGQTSISKMLGGEEIRRTFQDVPTKRASLSFIGNTDDSKRELEAFFRQARGSFQQFTFPSPLSGWHRDVLLGYGDGSKKLFFLNGRETSDVGITVDGVFKETGHTVYTGGNRMSDGQAATIGGLEDASGYGAGVTVALTKKTALVGSSCVRGSVSSSAANWGVQVGPCDLGDLGGSTTARACAWVMLPEGGSARLGILWSTGSSTSTGWGSAVTCTAGKWTQLTHGGAGIAGKTQASVIVEATTSVSVMYVDCLSVHPDDNDIWQMPSSSSDAVIFSTAPASGEAIYATFTGYRVINARLAQDEGGVTWDSIGLGSGAVEIVEVLDE